MNRRLAIGSLALALACPSPGPSEPPNRVDEPNAEAGSTSGSPEPAAEGGTAVVGDVPNEGCEGVCGNLHDCLLAEPDSTTSPQQAAALELDCLRQCVASGPAVSDSVFVACADAPACPELLPCMREAWPDDPAEPEPEPILPPSGSGCQVGCERLGQCFDAKPDEIDTCIRGCERKLDSTQMKAFGECVSVADCLAMLECMKTFPGASSP